MTVICNDRFPSKIAHGVYLARLCESLSGAGTHVELVVPKRFREVREDPFLYYDIRHPFRIVKIWSFDFIIFAKFFNKVAYWLQYLNFYLFIFFYFLFRSRSRIVYTMDYLGCLLSLLGFTVIFESHQWSEKYAGSLKPFLKLASAIVVTNSFIGAHFEKTGFPKEKILVAPNGVGLDRFTQTVSVGSLRQNLGLPLGKKIVSYIGKYRTLGAEKGVRELVSAIARLSPKYPNLFLLLVGFDEDERREVESQDLAVARRIDTEVRALNRLLDRLQRALVVGIDHEGARLGNGNAGNLLQGHLGAEVVDAEAVDECGRGPTRPHRRELVLDVLNRPGHLLPRLFERNLDQGVIAHEISVPMRSPVRAP